MKVLVTAASKHGSTAEIAKAIVQVLQGRGLDAEEMAPANVDDLGAYDAVVLGSAVYTGRWLEPATSLVARCAPQFAGRPVWLFSSGPIGEPPQPTEAPDVADLVTGTRAVDHRVFAGKLDKPELRPLERMMARVVHAQEGDYRDWGAVTQWASQIADTLVASSRWA